MKDIQNHTIQCVRFKIHKYQSQNKQGKAYLYFSDYNLQIKKDKYFQQYLTILSILKLNFQSYNFNILKYVFFSYILLAIDEVIFEFSNQLFYKKDSEQNINLSEIRKLILSAALYIFGYNKYILKE
ncbi:transmembrane protein, putative (macronuclear) [Tetrahymena thermophila SB210]|uniref:Transmembrane protein, putative n=1 Tax=Tetrahymena thermophila (strain SB210) TaxID=312017 RepID=W7XF77_TETTS|nr:transmembrane protein, putative [Tetrahymena thermophila SB210]EWS72641.1 transmembrane protein, putative [Tetrahymena thermophila SB210]|eukprot:XP_012654809.1 transmembrane protein, putative [Tetrahymena thermophila SB210]